jgi:hypothetical protein
MVAAPKPKPVTEDATVSVPARVVTRQTQTTRRVADTWVDAGGDMPASTVELPVASGPQDNDACAGKPHQHINVYR